MPRREDTTVAGVLLRPDGGDPYGLLRPGAPVEYRGLVGWTVDSPRPDAILAAIVDTLSGETKLLWFPAAEGNNLRLRLAWERVAVPEGMDRLYRSMGARPEHMNVWTSPHAILQAYNAERQRPHSWGGTIALLDSDGRDITPTPQETP